LHTNTPDSYIYQFITDEQFEIANSQSIKTEEHIFDTLVSLNFLTESQLSELVFQTTGFKSIDLDNIDIPASLWADFNIKDCQKFGYIPFFRSGNKIKLAIYDVTNLPNIDALKRQFANYQATIYFANQRKVLDKIHQYTSKNSSVTSPEALTFLEKIFNDAVRIKVSDIHFQPHGYSVQVRFRIDGVIHHVSSIHFDLWNMVLMRLKVLLIT